MHTLSRLHDIVFLSEHLLLEFENHSLVFAPGFKQAFGRPFRGHAFMIKRHLDYTVVKEFDFGILLSLTVDQTTCMWSLSRILSS